MSNSSIYIFDELFELMTNDDQQARIRNASANVHIVTKKCKIAEYESINDPSTQKILCINPDFVDWKFAAEDFGKIPGLQTIISSSDNISWLDTQYADERGINYQALKDLHSEYIAVAEYATTIMFNVARRVPLLIKDGFPADYAQDFIKYQGMDIAGKTVGIIGLGNIGSAIAKVCNGLGMKVTYWSRTDKAIKGYEYREIDTLLRESDIIFPTLKPNDKTKLLLPNNRLEHIKSEAIVVSVVSGLVDNSYVAQRVADHKLFGFGFGADPGVFAAYYGNVWAGPDYAWATQRNMQATYDQFVDVILRTAGQSTT